jgi:hypothetical protein
MSDVALESIFFPGVAQAGPTTLTLKGVPSRWFAEPRVSSKASVLVTHTIFSKFGEIRSFLNQRCYLTILPLCFRFWVS